ncbi:cysteine hydrolase family protein [Chloroflexota bacterium]
MARKSRSGKEVMMVVFEELVHPKHSAIVVIDVQNDFCHTDGGHAKRGTDISALANVVPDIIKLIEEGRKAGVPVIFVRNGHTKWTRSAALKNKKGESDRPPLCEEGTWGADFYRVQPLPGENIVIKYRFSAFIGTNFDIILRTAGIKTLIMSGVTTNTCVESTARQGFMMDYNIVFLKDCTATHHIEEHEATLHNIELNFGFVRSSNELFRIWSALPSKEKELTALPGH